jgi:hypothetical protein
MKDRKGVWYEKYTLGWALWLKPIILATQQVDIWRIKV